MSLDSTSNIIIKEWLSSAKASLMELAEDSDKDSDRMTDTDVQFQVPDHHLNEMKINNIITHEILEEIKALNASEKRKIEELEALKHQTLVTSLINSFMLVGIVLVINKMRN